MCVFACYVSFYTLNFCLNGEYHTCIGIGRCVYGTRQQFQCSEIREPKDPQLPVSYTRSVKAPGLPVKLPDTIVGVADRENDCPTLQLYLRLQMVPTTSFPYYNPPDIRRNITDTSLPSGHLSAGICFVLKQAMAELRQV